MAKVSYSPYVFPFKSVAKSAAAAWSNPYGVIRFKGKGAGRGFVSKNSQFYKDYVAKLTDYVEEKLVTRLPATLRSFMNNDMVLGTMPWRTGNLHDSLAATVLWKRRVKKSSGDVAESFRSTTGKVYRPTPVARRPQYWSSYVAEDDYDNTATVMKGWGRDFAKQVDPEEFSRISPEEFESKGNVIIYLSATMPYAEALDDGRIALGKWTGWFDDVQSMLEQKVRVVVNREVGSIGRVDMPFSAGAGSVGGSIGFNMNIR